MPSPDWLPWEFWAEAAYAPLLFWARAAAGMWAWYVCNREAFVPFATLIGGAVGIYYLAIRTRAADRTALAALDQSKTAAERHVEQTTADRERRITESFAKAGEQLGSDKIEARLVGIYTLERIAHESRREYWPIMETLTAFVRERAPWPPRQALTNVATGKIRLATDIQAVLTVLGRRDEEMRRQDDGRRLDLGGTDLRGANLREAHLQGASLWEADLRGAALFEANLQGAKLHEAHLEGANLWGAHLEGAELRKAHLQGVGFLDTYLEGADLQEAHLEGADLKWAIGLTREQLAEAFGDAKTKVADELRPAHWPAAPPDAPDNVG